MKTTLNTAIFEEIKTNIEGLTKDEAQAWIDEASFESGSVSGLIYHSDTGAFFKSHSEEILDIAKEWDFKPDVVDLGMTAWENTMAWFAFEVLKDSVFEERKDDFTFAK
jgi:hypothetical protein